MSTHSPTGDSSERVRVEIAGRQREARVLDRVWNPDYTDRGRDVRVQVNDATYWLPEADVHELDTDPDSSRE